MLAFQKCKIIMGVYVLQTDTAWIHDPSQKWSVSSDKSLMRKQKKTMYKAFVWAQSLIWKFF